MAWGHVFLTRMYSAVNLRKKFFVTCLENGDMGAMSVESLRRYIAALGGSLTLVADLPSGKVRLA